MQDLGRVWETQIFFLVAAEALGFVLSYGLRKSRLFSRRPTNSHGLSTRSGLPQLDP